jgi:Kef-type K+ transport system membrane component KefB
MVISVAFAGKLAGAAVPEMFSGIPPRDAAAVGVAMNSRGAVELNIAGIALRARLFAPGRGASAIVDNQFSSIAIVAVVTTLATPVLLRWLLPGGPRGNTLRLDKTRTFPP